MCLKGHEHLAVGDSLDLSDAKSLIQLTPDLGMIHRLMFVGQDEVELESVLFFHDFLLFVGSASPG